jgi:diguanylate cyclase (GGDEF)-like protein
MTYSFFERTFSNLQMPVIVCENSVGNSIIFANLSARLLLNPLLAIDSITGKSRLSSLSAMLKFNHDEAGKSFFDTLSSADSINKLRAQVFSFEGGPVDVSISANLVDVNDRKYHVIYICEASPGRAATAIDIRNILSVAHNIAHNSQDVEGAINKILALVGMYAQVSRAYIIEGISPTLSRNTYEWCNAGIEPAIGLLQNLRKEDYYYEVATGGMYIASDIRDLPARDRTLLEKQDVRSIALLPLSHLGKTMGYVGFNVCGERRTWSETDISIFMHAAGILVSLLIRRDMNRQAKRSLNMFSTISDSLEGSMVYVADIKTDEIIFASKSLCDGLGLSLQEVIGRKCWDLLQKNQNGRCGFCPLRTMIDDMGNVTSASYSWDFQNTVNGRWYLIRDSIIKWIDGRDVHIETAMEKSWSKEYEEKLARLATKDTLTGALNRERGYKIMRDAVRGAQAGLLDTLCLVFMNIDGLRAVNDRFGHDAGDAMVAQTVDIIRSSVRQSDFICRWGGDEFIMILHCNEKNASRILTKINDKMAATNAGGENPFVLSLSYGIAQVTAVKDESVDSLISAAEKLMYINKMQKKSDARAPAEG